MAIIADQDEPLLLRALWIAKLVVVAIIGGTLGYRLIEGWSLFDSLYMTVITLATVGYGETHPLSVQGRVFTIFLILFGISALTYALSTLTAFIVEGELKDVLRRRRMEARIAALSGHYVVCGGGHSGHTIMEELLKTQRPFVAVEKDPDKARRMSDRGILVVEGDAALDETLVKAGIGRARGLFAVLGSDPENAFVVLGARGLNPRLRIVAKEVEPGIGEKLRRSGADVVVDPDAIGGLRMASEMIRPAAVGFLDSMIRAEGKVFRIEEVEVLAGSPCAGKPLGELKGSSGNAALVLAVRPPRSKSYDINPEPGLRLEAGLVIVAMGSRDHIRDLEAKVSPQGDTPHAPLPAAA